jgi:hypothetical protein
MEGLFLALCANRNCGIRDLLGTRRSGRSRRSLLLGLRRFAIDRLCATLSYEIALEPKKVFLISSEKADKAVDSLRRANCVVLTAADGESALVFAKHIMVDAFILLSTGNSMGRIETALNLRDIHPFTEIILVARETGESTRGEAVAKAIPNTRVLTLKQLGDYLTSSTS